MEPSPIPPPKLTRHIGALHPCRDLIDQSRKLEFFSPSQRALPHRQATPASRAQRLTYIFVTLPVPSDLSVPEVPPSRRQPEHRAIVPVPEAPMNQNRRAIPRQHNVRLSRQLQDVRSIPESPPVQSLPDRHFRCSVPAAHRSHHPAPCLPVDDVSHRRRRYQRLLPGTTAGLGSLALRISDIFLILATARACIQQHFRRLALGHQIPNQPRNIQAGMPTNAIATIAKTVVRTLLILYFS